MTGRPRGRGVVSLFRSAIRAWPEAGGSGLALALVAIAGGPVWAQDCRIVDALGDFSTTGVAPAAATCSGYLSETNGAATACFWSFSYRSEDSDRFARTLWHALTACRPGELRRPDDAVNHPDSYALRLWSTETATYGLSVKDKGTLGLTMVFLRREPHRDTTGE